MLTRVRIVSVFCTMILAALFGLVLQTPKAMAATGTTPVISQISEHVRHELAILPWYGVFDNIEYQERGTEVTLSGQVISQHASTRHDAGKFVSQIPGVTKVVNNIEVLPPSRFDDDIRRAEYRAIFSQSDLGRYTLGAIPQVHIIVKGGHVSLEGVVMDQMDKNIAGIVANSVPGVFSVENHL